MTAIYCNLHHVGEHICWVDCNGNFNRISVLSFNQPFHVYELPEDEI
jgi:hypothetical protein